MMNRLYQKYETWIYRLLFVSFFLPHQVQTLLFIFFSCLVLLNAIFQKVTLTKWELNRAIIFGLGYLFYILYLPLTDPGLRHLLYSLLERKVSLLVMPFVIPLALRLSRHSFREELRYFAIANVLHGLLVNLLVLFDGAASSPLKIDHVFYRTAFESIAGIHPTYYGLYICLSLTVLLYDPQMRIWHRYAPAVLQVILLLYLLLLSPKISLMIALLLYAGHFVFVMRIKAVRKLLLLLASLSVMVLSYFTIPFFYQRIHEVARLLSSDPGNAIDNSMVFRKVILQTDLNLLHQSWLTGMGPARLQQNLDMAYLYLSGVSGVPVSSYNTHNEYLNQWICFGMAGLLYFIFIFYIHLKRSMGKSLDGKPDLIYLSCCLMIMISCMTENLFSRQHGVLFAALLLNLFYFEQRVSTSGHSVSADRLNGNE